MAAYATVEDLTLRFDERLLAELASDTGEPAQDIAGSARIAAALEEASGQVEAAALAGKRYTAEDLAALTGNARALLVGLVCDLAMSRLLRVRGQSAASEQAERLRERAEQYLDALARGERIFGVAKAAQAGLPTIGGPTASDYARLNLLPDRVRRFYPDRSGRLPIGRSY